MKNFFLVLCLTLFVQSITLNAQTAKTASINDYVGSYSFSNFFSKGTIEEKDGDLYAELDSYGKNKLIKQTDKEDYFKSTSSYGTLFTFKRNADGKVVGLKLELMGEAVEGTKD